MKSNRTKNGRSRYGEGENGCRSTALRRCSSGAGCDVIGCAHWLGWAGLGWEGPRARLDRFVCADPRAGRLELESSIEGRGGAGWPQRPQGLDPGGSLLLQVITYPGKPRRDRLARVVYFCPGVYSGLDRNVVVLAPPRPPA